MSQPFKSSDLDPSLVFHQLEERVKGHVLIWGLLERLATQTCNQVRFADAEAAVLILAEPTNAQREAFDRIGVSPLTLQRHR